MLVEYGSFSYFAYLVITALLFLAVASSCRGLSERGSRTLFYTLALVNLFQHLFKFLVWRHEWGTGFNIVNSAYNVCALFIIETPFLLARRRGVFRELLAVGGSVGAVLTFLLPAKVAGRSLFDREFLRFWTCHFLLLCTSLLPVLRGEVEFHERNAPLHGLCLLGSLAAILANNALFAYAGLAGEGTPQEILFRENPLWMMHPPRSAEFALLAELLAFFTPPALLGGNGRACVPILWYAPSMYLLVTGFSLALFLLRSFYRRLRNGAADRCRSCFGFVPSEARRPLLPLRGRLRPLPKC